MSNIDLTDWRTWFHGLLAAIISAIGVTGSDLFASLIDKTAINWHHLGVILGFTSASAAFLYLKQSPIPPFPDFKVQGPGTIQVPEGTTASVSSSPTPIDISKPISTTKQP